MPAERVVLKRLWRVRDQPSSDRGVALGVFVACAVPFMILILGIAVDCTGQIVLEQRARAVAAEAARSGGQPVQVGSTATPSRPTRLWLGRRRWITSPPPDLRVR